MSKKPKIKAKAKVTARTTMEMRTACWRVGQVTRWSSETASRRYFVRLMVFKLRLLGVLGLLRLLGDESLSRSFASDVACPEEC